MGAGSTLAIFQGLGAWEIVVIIVTLSLIFGASRLPEIGASLGKGIKNFKKSVTELESDVSKQIEEGENNHQDKT